MRSEPVIRLFRLLATLRYPRTLPMLANTLDVTTRTIRRDLETLTHLGVRVWRDSEHGTYQLSRPDMRLSELAGCGRESSPSSAYVKRAQRAKSFVSVN